MNPGSATATQTGDGLQAQAQANARLSWIDRERSRPVVLLTLVLLHAWLGYEIYYSSAVATAHAAATFCVGVWWAFSRPIRASRPFTPVAYIGAYIVGAEVLWRMGEASIPWEFGKYALAFVFLASITRSSRLKPVLLTLFYFLLLLPSMLLTTAAGIDTSEARQMISFNLSGPFALFVCSWFFGHTVLRRTDLEKILLALIGPVVGMLVIVIATFVDKSAAADIFFGGDSNRATSGGFGPNQVSSILGLAALSCFFFLFVGRKGKLMKAGMTVMMAVFLVQSGLTFSRSGIAMALGSAALAAVVYLKSPRMRAMIIGVAIVLTVLATMVVVPRLDAFTGGAFTERFTSLETTGRLHVLLTDIEMWQESPFLGVGIGMGTFIRGVEEGHAVAAHTEYSRMVGEHGFLGFTALLLLFVACARNILRVKTTEQRAMVVGLLVWVLLFMLVNAFRLAAPAFLFGLTFATWSMRSTKQSASPPPDYVHKTESSE